MMPDGCPCTLGSTLLLCRARVRVTHYITIEPNDRHKQRASREFIILFLISFTAGNVTYTLLGFLSLCEREIRERANNNDPHCGSLA